METFVGILAVSVIGGVFTFATSQIKSADERERYYREQVMPMMNSMVAALQELTRKVDTNDPHKR